MCGQIMPSFLLINMAMVALSWSTAVWIAMCHSKVWPMGLLRSLGVPCESQCNTKLTRNGELLLLQMDGG